MEIVMQAKLAIKPLAVAPKDGFAMIGVSKSKGWDMIANRELEAFKVGRVTRITVASIEAYVARQLAARQMAA
jgi:predicted DNA-binding transcriptional regulator AlpA